MLSPRRSGRVSRRQFVTAGALSGAAVAIGCNSRAKDGWEFLTDDQARTLAAICDQIIPQDDYPSASQAGVVTFIDRQLVRHLRRHRDAYRRGLKDADAMSGKRFGQNLANLSAPQQLEIVIALEQRNRVFFDLVRGHAMDGYYGSPRHGGNRDAVSWRMLGLPDPPLLGRAQYDQRKGSAS